MAPVRPIPGRNAIKDAWRVFVKWWHGGYARPSPRKWDNAHTPLTPDDAIEFVGFFAVILYAANYCA